MKKTVSILLALFLLFALTLAVFAAGRDVVYDKDATLSASFVAYNSIIVRPGVTVTVTSGSGFEISGDVTVEPGGAFVCSGVGQGQFNFCVTNPKAQFSGVTFYWQDKDTGAIDVVPGGFPAVAALDVWNFGDGWYPSFKWNASVQGWCLTVPLNGTPFGGPVYHSERDMDTALRFANSLHALGLFNGTGTGPDGKPLYELNRTGTRVEAVVMLVRFLGRETEAKNGSFTHPFTDVPDWAAPYVGYAYENGLTNGISATEFGPSATCTAQMYLTFMLRALGYSADDPSVYQNASELARQHGIFSTEQDSYELCERNFWRADMAAASYRLLEISRLDGKKLADKLIDDGVFTGEAYRSAR